MKKHLTFTLFFFLPILLFAQERVSNEKINQDQFFQYIASSPEGVVFENCEFGEISLYRYDSLMSYNRPLAFKNCAFTGKVHFGGFHFRKPIEFIGCRSARTDIVNEFNFYSGVFEKLIIKDSFQEGNHSIYFNYRAKPNIPFNIKSLLIDNVNLKALGFNFRDHIDRVRGGVGSFLTVDKGNTLPYGVSIINSTIEDFDASNTLFIAPIRIENTKVQDIEFYGCKFQDYQKSDPVLAIINKEENNSVGQLMIYKTDFTTQLPFDQFIEIDIRRLGTFHLMQCNLVDVSLNLKNTVIEEVAEIIDNNFDSHFLFEKATFPAGKLILDWSQLGEYAVAIERPVDLAIETTELHDGSTQKDIGNGEVYEKLINSYHILYNNYKHRGDRPSANGIFRKIKDLEGYRLAYNYWIDGGGHGFLSEYFINRLLKFTTDHGTSPWKPLAISTLIVLLFAVVFYFIPLNNRMKVNMDEVELDGGGKRVMAMLANGLDLLATSLNVFITLGFGSMPVSRRGRVLCVIEGALGWLMLSLFTVSLVIYLIG